MKSTLFVLMLFVGFAATAQNPAAVLEQADIDKFVETVRPMTKELEALGVDLDKKESSGTMNPYEALQANADAQKIMKKYGWGVDFSVKWMAIGMCYAQVKMDEQLAMMPEAQREQAKKMMAMANSKMAGMVNEKDLKLVKANKDKLDKVMEEDY